MTYSVEPCNLHDVSNCAECRPKPRRTPIPFAEDRRGPWFEARLDGHCDGAGCSRSIRKGDQIRSDGYGGWLCDTCGELPDEGWDGT